MEKQISEEYKKILRPVAEVLAMVDSNAFFDQPLPDGEEWYEAYLPEAKLLFESSGGMYGRAGFASFAKPFKDIDFPENRKLSNEEILDAVRKNIFDMEAIEWEED